MTTLQNQNLSLREIHRILPVVISLLLVKPRLSLNILKLDLFDELFLERFLPVPRPVLAWDFSRSAVWQPGVLRKIQPQELRGGGGEAPKWAASQPKDNFNLDLKDKLCSADYLPESAILGS